MASKDEFETELRALINRYSIENGSNTPDHILAGYLVYCLNAFEFASKQRETWYGRHMRPGMESREDSMPKAELDRCIENTDGGILDR